MLHRLADALLDRRDELPGDHAADDLVDELEAGAALGRLDLQIADAVLAVAAGLADVPSLSLGGRRDRLHVRDLRQADVDVDTVLASQPLGGDLDVGLA